MAKGRFEKTRTPVVNVAMCFAVVLFWLVIVTTYMSSGLFARYATQATGGDSARVIKFGELTVVGSGELLIAPGVDLDIPVTVSFSGSEAATYVFAEVVLTDSKQWTRSNKTFQMLNGKIHWDMAEGWTRLDSAAERHVFYCALAPNATLDNAELIKGGDIFVATDVTRTEHKSLFTPATESTPAVYPTITFHLSVVQSHGFANVDAAWASLAAKEVGAA